MDRVKSSGNSLMGEGIFSLIVGIGLLFLTGISQSMIVILFAAYAVILGIAQIIAARGERDPNESTTYLTILGVYSVVAGIILAFFSFSTLATIITLIAGYAIITGVAEAIAAYDYRGEMGGYMWAIVVGLVRSIFGIALLFNMGMSLSKLIFAISLYAIFVGVAMTIFGYEVKMQIGKYSQKPQIR